MKQYQKGATLIVVLFVLIFMVLIGTLAVKQSLVGLNVATNSQVQSLMRQTADAVFFSLERDNQNSAIFQKNLSSLGLFGMVKSDAFLNKELVFCYRPKTQNQVFNIQNASIIYPTETDDINNSELGSKGFCKYTSSDYSSGRDFMISQVAVKKSSLSTDVPFKFYPLGTDASTVQLNNCFKNHINDKSTKYPDQTTVAECFSDLGVPYSQQVMDYAVISYASKS